MRLLAFMALTLSLSVADHHYFHGKCFLAIKVEKVLYQPLFLSDDAQNRWNDSLYLQNPSSSQNQYNDFNTGSYYTQENGVDSFSQVDAPNYYAQDYDYYNEADDESETNVLETLIERYRRFGQRMIEQVGGVDRQAFAFLGSPVGFHFLLTPINISQHKSFLTFRLPFLWQLVQY